MAVPSPSSSSSFSYGFTYQVFLSFRGTDTRNNFTGNLYNALTEKGIHTFIDDNDLQRGDEITPSLIKAIEESRIFIPIFSANYASSSFCLDELVHIIHCYKTRSRLVLPVFYGVDPTHIRHQNGSYGEHLLEHEQRFQNNKKNMERLHQWKMALTQAANLSGYAFTNGYEYKFIGEIVKSISNKISREPLHVATNPVGLQSQVQQVKSLLDNGSDDGVHMVGIYGIGGMGKSTLARAVYNFVADQFEGLCFLHDVRENSAKRNLEHLQEKLLLKTTGSKIELDHVSEGIPIIKERLCRKKILLILDDVDNIQQLHALAGGHDWFGGGSRVIITTRNKHLLRSHGIESTHAVEGLNGTEALELLKWMAFKSDMVPSGYEEILNRTVAYASGLPLVLEITGSNLFGKSIEEWKGTLDGYEKIPNRKIQEILRVSYDALEEEEQSVFLDIACCFKGYRVIDVQDILHAHYGHCIKHHVTALAEKSLVHHQGSFSYVTLHDLIEDMGKEVVRQESPKLGERSRLWFHDDIVQVLKKNIGTENIEMIHLNCPSKEHIIDWNGKAFKKMTNLKTLIIENGQFSEGPKYLPSSLRLLKWEGCPLKSLSSSVLNKTFEKMKILKIDNCEYLTYISDVSCLPNLEIFSFENCKSLITIHDSVGFLSQLQILNAKGCEKLLSFPPLKLNSLHELKLSSCKSLKKFPEILGKMKNIKKIILRETGIEEFPFSFHNLTGLTDLTIEGCGILRLPSSILMMSNLLEVTILGYSQLSPKPNDKLTSSSLSSNVNVLRLKASNHEFLKRALMWFSYVEILHMSRSNIKILPECLKECLSIKCIDLDDCESLEEIRGIPPNLKALSALRCKSLTSSSKSMLLSQELHEVGGTEFCFPSSPSERIPEWFEHQSRESISFSFRNNLPSLVLFFSSKEMPKLGNHPPNQNHLVYYRYYQNIQVYLTINDNVYNCGIGLELDHTYLFHFNVQDWYIKEYRNFKSMLDEALLKNEWIHAEVRFGGWNDGCVVKSGIHVIKHLTSMDDFQFTDSSLCKKRKSDKYIKSSQSFIKSPNDEDISATPPPPSPRYRVLRTSRVLYYKVKTIEENPNSCAIM